MLRIVNIGIQVALIQQMLMIVNTRHVPIIRVLFQSQDVEVGCHIAHQIKLVIDVWVLGHAQIMEVNWQYLHN